MTRDIFVDTSAWLAIADRRDKYHEAAVTLFRRLLSQRVVLVTTNLVVAETHTLIRRTGGYTPAMRFLRSLKGGLRLQKVHSDAELEAEAEAILEKFSDQNFSLTDAVSIALMRQRGMKEAFAFDQHFVIAGFRLVPR